jgi:hypothetical protein
MILLAVKVDISFERADCADRQQYQSRGKGHEHAAAFVHSYSNR